MIMDNYRIEGAKYYVSWVIVFIMGFYFWGRTGHVFTYKSILYMCIIYGLPTALLILVERRTKRHIHGVFIFLAIWVAGFPLVYLLTAVLKLLKGQ